MKFPCSDDVPTDVSEGHFIICGFVIGCGIDVSPMLDEFLFQINYTVEGCSSHAEDGIIESVRSYTGSIGHFF